MGLRYRFALLAAKLSVVALKVTHHNGSNFPGLLALKLDPSFLAECAKPAHIIAITGTNGKTTCTNLVHDLLSQLGVDALSNSRGSNINSGIATALISGMTVGGRERYDVAVFEVDERSAARVFPYVQPDELVVNNLSRDSIMRNGHPEYIRNFLSAHVPAKTRLVLNADDPFSSSVAPGNPRTYFGVGPLPGDHTECHNLINDMAICPVCHSKLKYRYVRYSNIGKAYCPNGDFASPEYDVWAEGVDLASMSMEVAARGDGGAASERVQMRVLNESVFNIYNQVAATTLLHALGYTLGQAAEAMGKVSIDKSRFDHEEAAGVNIYLILCKDRNAYATSRVLEYVKTFPGNKEIMLVNNNVSDAQHWSENTCWLYDCDFELLATDDVKNVVVYGERALDRKLRLLLAGVPEDRISCVERGEDVPGAARFVPNDSIFVLYGTDSIDLGRATAKRLGELARERAAKGSDKEAQR